MRMTLPVLLLVAFWAQSASAQHLHPKVKSKELRFARVAVLPVQVDVGRSGFKGGESMMQESEAIADSLQSLVTRVFTQHGFTIVEEPLPAAASAGEDADAERREAVASLQSRFDAIAPQLMSKPKDVTKGRYSMGDEVSGLIADTVEAIVFVRGNGVMFTKGKRFMQGGLLGMAAGPRGELRCDVAIVDARTGDVLFLSRVRGQGDIVKKGGEQIEKPLSKHVKKVALRS